MKWKVILVLLLCVLLLANEARKKDKKRRKTKPRKPKRDKGSWTAWSKWSTCSLSCDGGRAMRTRNCRSKHCRGSSMEFRICARLKCPDVPNVQSSKSSTQITTPLTTIKRKTSTTQETTPLTTTKRKMSSIQETTPLTITKRKTLAKYRPGQGAIAIAWGFHLNNNYQIILMCGDETVYLAF